jgi:Helix-turn-helix domain
MRASRPQPALEVSRAPAAVRGYDDLDSPGAGGGQQLADVLVQADALGGVLKPRIDLAVLGEEVVIRTGSTLTSSPPATRGSWSGLRPSTSIREPHAWLLSQRLSLAQELLETTSLPIEQIAERVGYRNPAVFREQFTARQGLAPRDYRRTFSHAR